MSDPAGRPSDRNVAESSRRAYDALLAQLVEVAAERAAQLVLARLPEPGPASEYVTIAEAAEILRCKRQRIDDLLSAGKLARAGRDGRRVLIARSEIADYAARGGDTALTPPARTAQPSRFAR